MDSNVSFSWPAQWLIPDWPAPRGVHAVCTARAGGHSLPPFDGFNLGDHVGDLPAAVAANRASLQEHLGVRPVFLTQVHGWRVEVVDAVTPDGAVADVAVCATQSVACGVMVADCLPILLCDAVGQRVAAVHAGWRGLAGDGAGRGVVGAALSALAQLPVQDVLSHQSEAAATWMAWLGPCIGPQAFEVGPEVFAAFVDADAGAAECFVRGAKPDKWLANLPALARRCLAAAGVTAVYGNDGSAAWCTVGNVSRFFSHRRDHVSGRQMACIWLE